MESKKNYLKKSSFFARFFGLYYLFVFTYAENVNFYMLKEPISMKNAAVSLPRKYMFMIIRPIKEAEKSNRIK